MKSNEVIQLAKNHECRRLRLTYCNLDGAWCQQTLPISRLSPKLFEEGVLLRGEGRPAGVEAEPLPLRIVPDPASARLGPLDDAATITMLCHLRDATDGHTFAMDTRTIAQRASQFMRDRSIAEACQVGISGEFYLFDSVRFENTSSSSFFATQGPFDEALQRSSEPPTGAYAAPFGGLQTELAQQLCDTAMHALIESGIDVSATGALAGPGQSFIDLGSCGLVESADRSLWMKETVKRAARQLHKTVTFMPLPLARENRSCYRLELTLLQDNKNLFHNPASPQGSDMAIRFVNGILAHRAALSAFTNASTNSYRHSLDATATVTRRSAVHTAMADATCNPYLALPAIVMAGLDGLLNNAKSGAATGEAPKSLNAALDALAADHAFLLAGDVFNEELIEGWIHHKRSRDVGFVHGQPVPQEYELYYHC